MLTEWKPEIIPKSHKTYCKILWKRKQMIKGYFLCLFFCFTQFLKSNGKNYDFRGVKHVLS